MVATWQPAAPVQYYKAQTAYYLGGVEPPGRWYAPSGDFRLVDGAEVDLATFERLYCGVGADGRSLISNARGRAADRVAAYDITFSAPRSVSLAWAFASTETKTAIVEAHERSVRTALAVLEREATFARRGRGGERIEAVALSAALFRHGESRPAEHSDGEVYGDPNLHTHGVILNLATRADGTVGALHSVAQREWKMAIGATYHAALAAEIQALGFEIDRLAYNGVFEIAGVDDDLIRYFSARRNEIESELAKHGASSRDAVALAAAVSKATRGAKEKSGSANRERVWAEAAASRGVDGANFSEGLRCQEPVLDVSAAEQTFSERLAELPRTLTKTRSVFDRKDLIGAVASALVGTRLPVSRIDVEVEQLLAARAIVEVGRDQFDRPRYSTPEMVRLERETVACARRLAAAGSFALDAEAVRDRCEGAGLSEEQIAAALGATAESGLAVISGAPGSGKTTVLRPIVDGYRVAGHRVVGAASAWRVANALRDDLAIPSRAIASWTETLSHGGDFLSRGDVLVVDEAGLLAARETHALLGHAEKMGAKVLLVGDQQQLPPIGAGSGLGLVAHALDSLRVDTILRQRDAWARDAVRAFGEGRAKDALSSLAEHGKVIEAEGSKAAVDAIMAEWGAARSANSRETPLLLARTNSEVATISRAVREVLRAEGKLVGPDVEIGAVTPSGQSTTISVARGDRIRFLVRNDALGVVNGTTATVLSVHRDNETAICRSASIRIEADIDGRRAIFAPEDVADKRGRARLGWGYASTIYQSQGTTVDRAIALVDAGYDRNQIFVASSRAREDTLIVIDGKAIDRRLAADLSPDRQSEDASFSPEERRAWLATRLSKARTKESTLDAMEGRNNRMAAAADRDRERQGDPTQAPSRERRRSGELSLG